MLGFITFLKMKDLGRGSAHISEFYPISIKARANGMGGEERSGIACGTVGLSGID